MSLKRAAYVGIRSRGGFTYILTSGLYERLLSSDAVHGIPRTWTVFQPLKDGISGVY